MDAQEVCKVCATALGMRPQEFGCQIGWNTTLIACGSPLTDQQRADLIVALHSAAGRSYTNLGLIRFV